MLTLVCTILLAVADSNPSFTVTAFDNAQFMYSTNLVRSMQGKIEYASDEFIKDLAKHKDICRVYGHRWKAGKGSISIQQGGMDTDVVIGSERRCVVCGRTETREWKGEEDKRDEDANMAVVEFVHKAKKLAATDGTTHYTIVAESYQDVNYQEIIRASMKVEEVNEVLTSDSSSMETEWPHSTLELDNQHGTLLPYYWALPYGNPNEKTVTTIRYRVTSLTFKWNGKQRTVQDKVELWRTTQTYTKKEQWEPKGKPERLERFDPNDWMRDIKLYDTITPDDSMILKLD
jgi:hypothetical protein